VSEEVNKATEGEPRKTLACFARPSVKIHSPFSRPEMQQAKKTRWTRERHRALVNFTSTSEICSCQQNAASLHHCYNIRIISHLTAPSIWNLISTSGISSSSSHSFSSPRERRQGASETAAWRPKANRISNQDETSRAGGNLTKTLSRIEC